MSKASLTNTPRIAVIGAGCSGLAALKVLSENGFTNLSCFEKNDQIGGNWVYTAGDGHSSVCETTHIISSKWLSHYSDFPMPDHYPDYPSHQQVLAYFQDYSRTFGLERFIQFNSEIVRAESIENERWRLTLPDSSSEEFDYLLVANGHHAVPRHPAWASDFKGQYFHSHQFKNNRGLEGKRVLVIGSHPTVNSELLDKIRHGKVNPRPGVVRVEGQTVFFSDGTSSEYDTIISATGYKMSTPFFDPDFLQWEDATNVPLYLRMFHPQHKTMAFIGLVQPQGSVWPLSEAQAQLTVRLLQGQWKLPDDLSERARAEGEAIEKEFLKSPRHAVEVHFHPYLRKLQKLATA